MINHGSFDVLQPMGFNSMSYYSLSSLEHKVTANIARLPFSIKILLASVLRNCDSYTIRKDDVMTLANWQPQGKRQESPYKPARVVLQDFTGVPALVDLAAMRDAMSKIGDALSLNDIISLRRNHHEH
jgi:aconitate hydratase